jgi:hypothetical protein
VKIPEPYRCDYCERIKGATNHWWMRRRTDLYLEDVRMLQMLPLASAFILLAWDDGRADERDVDHRNIYEHICSESCALKAVSKWMARFATQASKEPLEERQGAWGAEVVKVV